MTALIELKNQQQLYRTRAFRMMIETALVLGIPAFGAFFAGQALDRSFATGKTFLLISLALAFVCSWTIILVRWKTLDRALREADRAVRNEERKRKEKGGLLTPLEPA